MRRINSTGSYSSRDSESTTTTADSHEDRVYREQNGHYWYQKFLKRPTWCAVCNKFVYGLTIEQQNAFKCFNCKLVAHHDCHLKLTAQCQPNVTVKKDSGSPKAAVTFADVVMNAGNNERGFTARDAVRQTGKVIFYL